MKKTALLLTLVILVTGIVFAISLTSSKEKMKTNITPIKKS